MRVLYLGPDSGTCRHRAHALRRLGHHVEVVDPRRLLPRSHLVDALIFRTGAFGLSGIVERRLLRLLDSPQSYELVWVDGGDLVGPSLVRRLKQRYGMVINYNIDDPFGGRDSHKWRNYLAAVREYDLLVVMREMNVAEAQRLGARQTLRVFMSSDEMAHRPRAILPDDRKKWQSDVLFVGTWMPERGPLLHDLTRQGIPLSIYGDRWQKAPEWKELKPSWRGDGLYVDDHYAKAVQCAKICVGLLSKGNRDQHTTRSMEIPYLGGVLLAERTNEHLSLYKHDEEAVFWNDTAECAALAKSLLEDEAKRTRIAAAGRARAIANQHLNEAVVTRILDVALKQRA